MEGFKLAQKLQVKRLVLIEFGVASGAGLLNIPAALDPTSTAEPAMISFGEVGAAQLPVERSLTLTNPGTTTATYQLTVVSYDEDTAARVTIEDTARVSMEDTDSDSPVDKPPPLWKVNFLRALCCPQQSLT